MSAAVASEPQPADPLVSLQHAASQSAGVDSLTCQWLGCGDRSTSPEALYEHVCDKHVGRKSTNNLNLQCQWGNCRTTTVKRDHITSHIRVHVPLKPHKCDFCQKSFKRPQDLKKHVKTHADDSVLLDSPEATTTQRSSISSANYQTGVPKSAGYYTNDNSMNHGAGYPVHAQTSNNYSFGMSNGSSSYGPVYYGSAQAAGDYALTESRKRGHDALNEFFGDAKRRLIDANTYQDLGARFGGLASLGLPVGNDYAAGYTGRANDYTTATVYQASMPAAPVNYTLPFSELKTKHDLMSIDQFLEQLQNTVYEHPDQAAASGYAHPGLHQQSTGMYGQRQSLSPGYATHQSSTPGARSSVSLAPSNLDDGTPALTPASYNSTHSPVSAHSHPSAVSPAPRPTGSMYPTLPSLNEMQQFGYSSGAPASGLANAYDDLDSRRRYSGGFLQRAQPARRSSPPQSTDNLSRRSSTDAGLSKGVRNVDLSSPKPAAAAPPTYRRRNTGSSDGSSAASADGRSEAWVQNVRIIEALRDFVRARLEKGEFDDDAAAAAASREHAASSSAASPSSPSQAAAAEERRSATPTQAQPHPQQQQQETDTEMGEAREQKPGGSLYPILRAVEATS